MVSSFDLSHGSQIKMATKSSLLYKILLQTCCCFVLLGGE